MVMNDVRLYNIGSVIFLIIGSLTFILTYVRASINKSDRDLDQNTISSLRSNNEALAGERDMWRERANKLEGQNKVLQGTVTAAPQIVKLTRSIAKHQADNAKWQRDTTKLQNTLISEIKGLVEAISEQRSRA